MHSEIIGAASVPFAMYGKAPNERRFQRGCGVATVGKKVAIATVVSTWGSSPRPVGSQLAVDDQGCFIGSVSGGCIESAVVDEAFAVLEDGRPRLLTFGITNEMA